MVWQAFDVFFLFCFFKSYIDSLRGASYGGRHRRVSWSHHETFMVCSAAVKSYFKSNIDLTLYKDKHSVQHERKFQYHCAAFLCSLNWNVSHLFLFLYHPLWYKHFVCHVTVMLKTFNTRKLSCGGKMLAQWCTGFQHELLTFFH